MRDRTDVKQGNRYRHVLSSWAIKNPNTRPQVKENRPNSFMLKDRDGQKQLAKALEIFRLLKK